MEKDKKTPITLDNVDEIIDSIPPEQFEKDRKKIEKRMAESREYWKDRAEGKNMMFLMVDILSDNDKTRVVKLTSDLETATATIDKTNWSVKINGFERSLKYVYPKWWVEKFIINMAKNNPLEKHSVYGRG